MNSPTSSQETSKSPNSSLRVNVGCGQTPVPGWRNFDNSLTVQISKFPFLPSLLYRLKLIKDQQYQFSLVARDKSIEWANATKKLPLESGSVEVVYSSHMIEHLDRSEALLFLKEVKRVLRPGGFLRLAIPDIRKQVQKYIENGDADEFIAQTQITQPRAKTFMERLRLQMVGQRNHQWMYDGKSLTNLLTTNGFVNATEVPAGETRIPNPRPLDLFEREDESAYVEAENTGSES